MRQNWLGRVPRQALEWGWLQPLLRVACRPEWGVCSLVHSLRQSRTTKKAQQQMWKADAACYPAMPCKRRGRKMVTIVDPHVKRDHSYYIFSEATDKKFYVLNRHGHDFDG